MTLEALFIPAEGTVVNGGGTPVIPLSEMPLGAFSEMVERHLGRNLTDDNGQDLATWLESATANIDPHEASQASAMAHMLVTMARKGADAAAAEGDAASVTDTDGAEDAKTTFGSRIAAIARSIGLPIGSKTDAVAAEAGAESTSIEQAAISTEAQLTATKPFAKPKMSREERQAVLEAASTGPEPIVIDLRSDDPFAAGIAISETDAGMSSAPRHGAQTPGVSAHGASQDGVPDAIRAMSIDGAPTPGHAATSALEQRIEGMTPSTEPTETGVVRTVEAGDTTITIDLSRFEAAGATGRPTASQNAPQAAPTTAPMQIPQAAVERVMKAVELQASAPPPRMAVVDVPELDGLRIMVSVSDTGAVAVTALGNSTSDSVQIPFMQNIIDALENHGFELDDRSRGRNREERQTPEERQRNRQRPRRSPRHGDQLA